MGVVGMCVTGAELVADCGSQQDMMKGNLGPQGCLCLWRLQAVSCASGVKNGIPPPPTLRVLCAQGPMNYFSKENTVLLPTS